MNSSVPDSSALPTRPALPRAAWIGGGLFVLVGAALAGALVMRSVQPSPLPTAPAPVPAVTSSSASGDTRVGTPVPLVDPGAASPPHRVAPNMPPGPASPKAPVETTVAPPAVAAPVPACATCGRVESVRVVKVKGKGSGAGAVAGGVLGGVVGHQLGGGGGKTALTVLGAIGGGLAGNEVERRVRSTTLYDVHVRMDDGSRRVIRRAATLAVGTRVIVEGEHLRVAARPHKPGRRGG
jgi:outer membrane lipoprotein SlyB